MNTCKQCNLVIGGDMPPDRELCYDCFKVGLYDTSAVDALTAFCYVLLPIAAYCYVVMKF